MCNLVAQTEEGTHAEDVREESAEEDIWAEEGRGKVTVE